MKRLMSHVIKVNLLLLFMGVFCISSSVYGAKKPDSKFGGLQIGTITYSYRSMPDQSLQGMLEYTVESGISSVELMGGPVEQYAGIPQGGDKEAVRQWRTTVSMDKFKEIRNMFKKKGVKIDILKLGEPHWSDEEIDYAFNVCRTLGARGITTEISEDAAKRLAPFAEKHGLYVILHNHGQPGDPNFSFDKVLAHGKNVMLNFDIGHYFGATGIHPNVIIERLHDRIASIHVKDKTAKDAKEPDQNRQFGKGDTPLRDVLKLIQRNRWPITCDIELEYNIPEGSDAVKEVNRCMEFCKHFLAPRK